MNTASAWAPVVAALGASLLTILGTFGLFQWQRWRDNRAKAKADKLAAYTELYARTFSFERRVGTLGIAKQFRSGLNEGVAVVLRQQRPVDVFELHEWLDLDFRSITDAHSKVCVIGSQEAIDIANRLVDLCGELMSAAIASDPHQRYLVRLVRGERQTAKQQREYAATRSLLFKEREIFANLIRQETGHKAVVLPLHRSESAKSDVAPTR